MSSHKTARVARVLSGALRVWGVSASVGFDSDALVMTTASGVRLQIAPAAASHGWLVWRDGRSLGMHAGLPGLLRTIRDEL